MQPLHCVALPALAGLLATRLDSSALPGPVLPSGHGREPHRASHDNYEDPYLPTGTLVGTAEEALEYACNLGI